jgi:predicted ArsR family transcriptional regulator
MRQVNLTKNGGKDMVEIMTDKQFKTILEMVDMILDGCKDLEEAKKKVQKLIENQSGKEKTD